MSEIPPPPQPRDKRRFRTVWLAIAALAVTVPAVAAVASVAARPAAVQYQPAYGFRDGRELVMVFVGASFCRAHQREGFPEALEQAKVAMAAEAARQDVQFRAIGVSMDWQPEEAIEFLNKFGRFDEMALGGNWVNQAVIRYVWRDLPGRPSVPQVILLERTIEKAQSSVNVVNEQVVRRLTGTAEITAWAKAGAPLRAPFPMPVDTAAPPAIPSPAAAGKASRT
jgi:hypothetical protein